MSPEAPSTPSPPAQRRYHFHWPGVTYVVVVLFLAVGALNSQNNLLFATLGVAMGGLLASGLISGWSLMGLRLERDVPAAGSVGEAMAIHYVVHNSNRLMPVFALHVEEVRPRRAQKGWWMLLDTPRAFVTFVPPRGRSRVVASVTPRARGEAALHVVRVWSTFPFGLAKKSMWFEIPGRALVYPAHLRLRPAFMSTLTDRSPRGAGDEPSPGTGDEFFGLREYAPGDSPRRIAWKPSARTGTLVIRQHSAPSPVRLWVILRLGAPRGAVADERAIALAASVLREAERRAIAVGLCIPLTGDLHLPHAQRRQITRMLESLARLDLQALAERRGVDEERDPPATRRGATLVIDPRGGQEGAIDDTPENRRLLELLGHAP